MLSLYVLVVGLLKSMTPSHMQRVILHAQAHEEVKVCEPGKEPEKKNKRNKPNFNGDRFSGANPAKKEFEQDEKREAKEQNLVKKKIQPKQKKLQAKQKHAEQKKLRAGGGQNYIPTAEHVNLAQQKKLQADHGQYHIPTAEHVDMGDPNTIIFFFVVGLLRSMPPSDRQAVINVALQ